MFCKRLDNDSLIRNKYTCTIQIPFFLGGGGRGLGV